MIAAPTEPGADGNWLAGLAATWIDRWLAYGGCVHTVKGKSGVAISMRVGRDARWRSKSPHSHQRLWHDGWKVGRWRELDEMASYVPGLYDAITEHVVQHGTRYTDGSVVMMRSADDIGVV